MKIDIETRAICVIMNELLKLTNSQSDRVMKFVAAKFSEERFAKEKDEEVADKKPE